MDSGTVKTFTDAAAQLLPALVLLASTDPSQRSSEDEALIRQMRVAAASVASALSETPRQQPRMPQMVPPAPADAEPPAQAA